MKQITYIYTLILLFVSSISFGQVQMGRQVLGSTGGFATSTNGSVSSTVGEAVITTQSSANLILTQGFQQTFKGGDSNVTATIVNETCIGASNGSIEITNVLGCPGSYTWEVRSVGDSTLLLTDSLSTGDYNVLITGSNGCVYPITLFVGIDSDENCLLKFYSGFTPNNDGVNDVWLIDNIEQFPGNTVQIFNRWGEKLWYGEGYNNETVVWDGMGKKGELASATYFYVANVGGSIYKGWV